MRGDAAPMTSGPTVEPRAFLADFGLAKAVATGSKLTRTGQALGTPAYMSPEQARGEVSALTPATDLWSLGCVLYEMLASRPPFEGDTDAAVVGNVIFAESPRLRTLRADVSQGLECVVRVCLGKRVQDRHTEAGALRDDLDRVLRGERPTARPDGSWVRKAAVAALCVASVSWAAAYTLRGRGPEGLPATASSSPSAAEALATRARALRQSDPRRAAEVLRAALEREPSRDDLRLERGLLLWAVGENAEAREEWGRIGYGSSEGTQAKLFLALEVFFRMAGAESRPHLVALREAPGRVGSLARGAVRVLDSEWSRAREDLRGVEGWEAHLLRGYIESWDPAGDRAAAVRAYGSALDSWIPFAWAWNNRGVARRAIGEDAGAVADYSRALQLDPRYAEAWNNRGNAKGRLGDHAAAVADLDRALELNPRYADAWNNRGAAKRALGDYAGAVADLDRALELDPRYATTWHNRAVAKQALGDLAGAIADYGRGIELDPRLPAAWSNRAAAKAALGDLAGAMADWDQTLGIDPQFAEAWNNRGGAKRLLGDPAGALADLDHALGLDPRSAWTWHHRGLAKRDLGDLAGAVADLDRALELDPRLAVSWSNRGAAKRRLADHAGAVADLDRALELDPRNAAGWADRSLAKRDLGDPAGAVTDGNRSLELDPRNAAAWNIRGVAKRDLGDLAGALEDLSTAIRLAPEGPFGYSNRGLVFAGLGRLDEALADAEKALSMDPKGPYYAYAARGLVFIRQGKHAAALADLERFESLAIPADPLRKDVAAWKAEAARGAPK